MKRKDFVKFIQDGKTNHSKECVVKDKSVTDPSFAQSGRAQIFNPLPINYRVSYTDGVPLNKDNPMQFNEFDKMYPDKFIATEQARKSVKTIKEQFNKIDEQTKPKPQPQDPNPNPNN